MIDGRAEQLSPSALLDRIMATEPELVGISSFSCTINDAYLLAKWIKRANPDVKSILGGVHVSQLPYEALQNPDVDFVIRGVALHAQRRAPLHAG